MGKPVTLCSGQWADLPLEQLAPLAKSMGFDGLELACLGDHFDVDQAVASKKYRKDKWALLSDNGLTCYAVSNHCVGQAVCDLIDDRNRTILPDDVWGDGDPEGVRRRAAKRMIATGKAARAFLDDNPAQKGRASPAVVVGFTGSSIWHSVTGYPPVSKGFWEAGFKDFARRFGPILEAYDKANVNFAFEVDPTEIAFDIASAEHALVAIRRHRRFGFNYDPSHLGFQGVDYVLFLRSFAKRIFHVHMKDVWWGHGGGAVGVYGGHTSFGDQRRYWDYRSLGHGDIKFEDIIVTLNDIGYAGPLSVEWEDVRMDRVHGATEAAAFVRKLDFKPNAAGFDAAFMQGKKWVRR